MNTTRRTRILVEGDRLLLAELAEQIENSRSVRVERPPSKGLALTKAVDSASLQPFYVGELLLTECTVAIGDTFGVGAVMGDDPDKAYELAVVDAACRAGLPETQEWLERLEEEERQIERRQLQEQAIAMRTKVDFDTLEGLHDKR